MATDLATLILADAPDPALTERVQAALVMPAGAAAADRLLCEAQGWLGDRGYVTAQISLGWWRLALAAGCRPTTGGRA